MLRFRIFLVPGSANLSSEESTNKGNEIDHVFSNGPSTDIVLSPDLKSWVDSAVGNHCVIGETIVYYLSQFVVQPKLLTTTV